MGKTCEKDRRYMGLYGRYIHLDVNHGEGLVGVYHETSLMLEVNRDKLVGTWGSNMKEQILNKYGSAILSGMYQNMDDVYRSLN